MRRKGTALQRYLRALAFFVVTSGVALALASVYYQDSGISRESRTPDDIAAEYSAADGQQSAPLDDDGEETELASYNHHAVVNNAGGPDKPCKETYGMLPCSNSLPGSIFLTMVYGAVLTYAAQCIGDGGEALLELEVLPPSIIGGLLLPILGAVPDAAIIAVSGMAAANLAEAEEKIAVGVGTLAGSTIMLLTIAFSGSLWYGRCDIVDGQAQDRTLNGAKWTNDSQDDLCEAVAQSSSTGITHNEHVLRIKWFMLASSLCYLVAQLPAAFTHDPAVIQTSCLVGAVVCVVVLAVYLVDSAVQAQGEVSLGEERKQAKTKLRYSTIAAQFDAFSQGLSASLEQKSKSRLKLTRLFRDDGSVSPEAVDRMFDVFDADHSGYLDEEETKKLAQVVFVNSGQQAPDNFMRDLTTSLQDDVEEDAVVVDNSQTGGCYGSGDKQLPSVLISRPRFMKRMTALLEANMEKEQLLAAEEPDEEDAHEVQSTVSEACWMIVAGTFLATFFSDAIVDSIDAVGQHTGIPVFVIGFVVCPIASNASELISSLQLAARKKKTNASVTFSQIYAACTMNNCMCLGIFFFLVWYKQLSWDYAAEVISILLVTWVVGLMTLCDTTIRLWVGGVALLLYPFSLALVEGLKSALK